MNALGTALTVLLGAVVITSCALYPLPEVSGPYAGAFRTEDVQQISELAFSEGGIRRGVHSIYAKKPNEADVQKWNAQVAQRHGGFVSCSEEGRSLGDCAGLDFHHAPDSHRLRRLTNR